jgi:surfeit locus 1 family protein
VKYTFRPSLLMTLFALVAIALCIKAGLWQYNKAQARQALQTQLSARLAEPPVALPETLADIEAWRYKRVKFFGVYDTRFQVLLDNQVENTKVGYHVFTPMQVEGSKLQVLVNRGWIIGNKDRSVPVIDTPLGRQEIEGDIGLPAKKFFTLEAQPAKDGKLETISQNQVLQHLDMARYAKSVPFAVQPFVVRLDAQSKAGGFTRNWPAPGDKVTMHLGYAYQWFGFALTLLVIYIVLNFKLKRTEESKKINVSN